MVLANMNLVYHSRVLQHIDNSAPWRTNVSIAEYWPLYPLRVMRTFPSTITCLLWWRWRLEFIWAEKTNFQNLSCDAVTALTKP